MSKKFGFIGLGNMGVPMAGRLLDAGFPLVVFDARASAVDAFVARGAERGESAADVASKVDTLFLSLPTPPIVEAVALGDNGISSGSSVKRVVDLSTTGPEMAENLGKRMTQHGIRWIDSPVSGGVGGAKAGTLAVMFSGPHSDFEDLQEQLKVIGKPFYIGDQPGLAQTMKLVNNLLSAAAMVLSSEAVAMGAKAGIKPKVMIDVINAGSGRNTATMQKFPQAVLPGTFDYGFSTGLMNKDVQLFVQVAKGMGLTLGGCEVISSLWQSAVEKLGADSDFTEIVKLIEQPAGVELRDDGSS